MQPERLPHNPGPPPPYPSPYPGPGQGQFPHPPAPYPAPFPAQTGGRTSFGRCVLATLVWVGAALVIIFATLGPPASGRALGQVIGTMVVPLLLGALVTWLFFRRKRTAFWILAVTALPTFVVLGFLIGAARLAGQQ